MNIDRPLDELIQESREAKRAELAEKRKAFRQTKKVKNANTPAANGAMDTAKGDTRPPRVDNRPPRNDSRPVRQEPNLPVSRKQGITKKRRSKKGPAVGAAVRNEQYTSPEPEHAPPAAPPAPRYGGGQPRKQQYNSKGVKVKVSNLHSGVTQADIAELFETVGPLRSAILHLHPNGESMCEAEVVFENMGDALEAIKRYNMVPLDNLPLNITLATDSVSAPPPAPEPVHSRVGNKNRRGPPNGRKRRAPEAEDYEIEEEEDEGSPRGNGYPHERGSPRDDRPGGNGGPGRRHNRKRYRRYNKHGNGNIGGGDRGDRGRDSRNNHDGRGDYDD